MQSIARCYFMRLTTDRVTTSLVRWSLVRHIRELWQNGASESYWGALKMREWKMREWKKRE